MRMNISVPDELAAQVRRHGIAISATCQRALRRELRRLGPAVLPASPFSSETWERDCRAALERAIGYYRMKDVDWEQEESEAAVLRLAEEDAIHALRELAQDAADLAREIEDPSEPQDERRPFRYTSLSDVYEAATIAMAQLAAQRNHVRPSR